MRVEALSLQEIQFTYTEYSQALYQRLLRIGLSFPIRVLHDQEGYHCIDGHKRLSAIYDILQQNPKERHFQSIKAINHGNARTQPPQSLQNHH